MLQTRPYREQKSLAEIPLLAEKYGAPGRSFQQSVEPFAYEHFINNNNNNTAPHP